MTKSAANCTWEGCEAPATHEQRGQDGRVWANLCETHDKAMQEAYEKGDVKRILSNYVKAQGGAKKAAERM